MTNINCYLTKDFYGLIELWKSIPIYDGKRWNTYSEEEGNTEDVLNDVLKEGQCAEIQISINKVLTDYELSPEGKLMTAIFGKDIDLKELQKGKKK